MKKIVYISLISATIANALEFGFMGNTPASVGGAGVAYKKNSWAMYYNPALLGVNRDYNTAYSFSIGYGEKNLAPLANIDYNNIINIANKVNPTTRNIGRTTRTTTTNYENLGIFSDMLSKMNDGSGIKNESDLKTYLDKISGNSTTSSTLGEAIKKIQGSTESMQKIKQEMLDAANATPNGGLLSSVIQNLDVTKIGDLLNGFDTTNNGGSGTNNVDFSKILTSLGGVTISRGADSDIDKFLDDYAIVNRALYGNNLQIQSNNGYVFHFAGDKARGALGVGLLVSMYGNINIDMDKTHTDWIIQNGSNYYKVNVTGSSVSLTTSTSDNYNNQSILSPNAQHNIYSNMLVVSEVPISYGHRIPFYSGDFYIGGSIKYIYATSAFEQETFNLDSISFRLGDSKNTRYTPNVGVDIGALYSVSGFSIGFVGKNLNSPKIRTTNGKFRLDRQFRAGVGFEIWKTTFLLDIDLAPNSTLQADKKNQMIGGGVILDASYLDFRLGAMRDLRANPYGTIITGGINILNFIDIAVQSSLIMTDMKNIRLPNYFNISIGGRYIF